MSSIIFKIFNFHYVSMDKCECMFMHKGTVPGEVRRGVKSTGNYDTLEICPGIERLSTGRTVYVLN